MHFGAFGSDEADVSFVVPRSEIKLSIGVIEPLYYACAGNEGVTA